MDMDMGLSLTTLPPHLYGTGKRGGAGKRGGGGEQASGPRGEADR